MSPRTAQAPPAGALRRAAPAKARAAAANKRAAAPTRRPAKGRRTPRPSSGRPSTQGRALPYVVGGVVWAGLLVVTVSTTVAGLAVVVTVVALLAAPTAWRAARRAQGEPVVLRDRALLGGLLLIGLCPLAAAADPWVGVVVLAAGAAVVGVRGGPSHRPVLAAALPGLAGLGLVALAGEGGQAALVLVLAVCLFDAANALMGTGESGGVLGAVAGVLTVAVLAVAVQAVLVPPFTSAGVWILLAVAALGAPAGVVLCQRVAPGRVPALRRLDSLVLVGPVWAVAALALVHH